MCVCVCVCKNGKVPDFLKNDKVQYFLKTGKIFALCTRISMCVLCSIVVCVCVCVCVCLCVCVQKRQSPTFSEKRQSRGFHENC